MLRFFIDLWNLCKVITYAGESLKDTDLNVMINVRLILTVPNWYFRAEALMLNVGLDSQAGV